MKRISFLITVIVLLFFLGCSSDNDEFIRENKITLKFSENWKGKDFTKKDSLVLGKVRVNIDDLHYLISDVSFVNARKDSIVINTQNIISAYDSASKTIVLDKPIIEGTYTMYFTFGLNRLKNKTNSFPNLNEKDFNVPDSLGGNYYFMKMVGSYLDTLSKSGKSYNINVLKAVDKSKNPPKETDTSFLLKTGVIQINYNTTINIKMDVSTWFSNPNSIDIYKVNNDLELNYDAQIKLSANGKNSFSIGKIEQ